MSALRIATLSLWLVLLTSGSALAGPPLITDDAGTVETGRLEVELNGSYSHDRETTAGVSSRTGRNDAGIKITSGLYRNLAISLSAPYTIGLRENVAGNIRTVDGFGDMVLEVKYGFAELAGINFAIKPTIILSNGRYSAGLSEGRWQYGASLIASRELEEDRYALHANLAYWHHDYRTDDARAAKRSDLCSGSIAGEMKLTNGLSAVLDLGVASNPYRASSNLPAYALTGLRYGINDHLDVSAGVKVGLTKPEDDISVLYGLVLKI